MNGLFAIFGHKVDMVFESIENQITSHVSNCNKKTYFEIGIRNEFCILANITGIQAARHQNNGSSAQLSPCVSLTSNTLKYAQALSKVAPNCDSINEALYTGFLTHGADCFSRLPGDFVCILNDQNTNELVLACSAFNSRTLFYTQIDGCTLVSSDVELLGQIVTPEIDELSILGWLSGRPDPNRSMFQNIQQVPQANMVKVSLAGQITSEKLWDIDPNNQIHYSSETEYQSHFLTLLKDSVAARTLSSQSMFSQLSGGMDSTSITALAKQISDDRSAKLTTISHTYRNTKSCDELDNINSMLDKLALQRSHFVELDEYTTWSFSKLYPTRLQSPGIVMSPKYYQEAALIKAAGADLLLTGNGGDEMCWGHSYAYRDRLMSGELSVISEVLGTTRELNMPILRSLYNVLIKPSMPHALLAILGKQPINDHYLPPWLTPKSIAQLTEQDNNKYNPFDKSTSLAKKARYEGLFYSSTYNSMRSYQAIGDQYGFEVQHPFFDKAIAEFSFAIPQKQHIRGRFPKYLLRCTMHDYLPASVCWDQTKTVFDQHFANLVRANQNELRQLLSHRGLHDLGLIDNDQLMSSFERVVNDPNGSLNVDLLYAILTQSWYQTHIVNP